MVREKPDVGLISKKYNEEHYKNIAQIETIFANNEEKVVNSLSFLDIKPTKKWSEEETNLFYRAIELFGLDFSLLEIVLRQRTREEIKRKYLREKKINFEGIEKAFKTRKNSTKLKQILELYKKEKEKIFNITKVPKDEKERRIQMLESMLESNNAHENEKENDDINNISNEEYEEENNNCEKKIFKKDILACKGDEEIISQKEEFINKCLDSKDPKDFIKLLTYFGNG